jgi:hypothetical protein
VSCHQEKAPRDSRRQCGSPPWHRQASCGKQDCRPTAVIWMGDYGAYTVESRPRPQWLSRVWSTEEVPGRAEVHFQWRENRWPALVLRSSDRITSGTVGQMPEPLCWLCGKVVRDT